MINIRLDNDRISKNFRLREFMNESDNNAMILNEEVLFFIQVLLEEFRAWYKRPIAINSGYRTKKFNDTLKNASKTSRHLKALAIDVPFPNEPMTLVRRQEFLDNVKEKWMSMLKARGMTGGVGFYDWGFHIDAGNDGPDRFWDYRTKKK